MRTSLRLLGLALLITPKLALAYDVAPVRRGGSIDGAVAFEGTAPPPKKMTVTKDEATCGSGARDLDIVAVDARGGLAEAVVYLDEIKAGKPWSPAARAKQVLDQRGCRYVMRTLVVRKGDKLTITNSDPVFHNIHAYETIGTVRTTLFNVAQPKQGLSTDIDVNPRRGNTVKLECDAHDFMGAWLFTASNPYFAVSGKDGAFSIGNVPAGHYVLKAWHPVLGLAEAPNDVSPGKRTKPRLVFHAE